MHVYPVSSSSYTSHEPFQEALDSVRLRMNKLSCALCDELADRVMNVVLAGDVERTMLRFVKEHKFDLIIVGINSNGQNNEIGSHARQVMQTSSVPVMVVPNQLANA